MIRIVTQYYTDGDATRQREIDFCLQSNLAHPAIEQVVIHLAKQDRPTFQQLLRLARILSAPDDINIIANSDIYFDDTLVRCLGMKPNELYSLGRWDVSANGPVLFDNDCAQDAWFFRGPPRDFPCEFCMGHPGCDNRLSWEAKKAGYDVYNPARTIRGLHVHASEIRHYCSRDRIRGEYLFVTPTELESNPQYDVLQTATHSC